MKVHLKILIFFASILFDALFSQSNFSVKGLAVPYDGKELKLNPIFLNPNYPARFQITVKNDKFKVINNSFYVEGTIKDFPQPLEISFYDATNNRVYYSIFFIDNKKTNYIVSIPDLTTGKHIDIKNSKSQTEYNVILDHLHSENIDLMPFDENNFLKKYNFLNKYIHTRPNSFVALWMIVSDYRYVGYKSEFNNSLKLFGENVKYSSIYKDFIDSLEKDQKFATGKKFPILSISNTYLPKLYGKKYTVVEFWFSYCQPCIKDIPEYQKIYDLFKDRGLEYISISTDRIQDKAHLESVIRKYNLKWINLFDENGRIAAKNNINQFPTTFLLNSIGEIEYIGITPDFLKDFLIENLK